MAVKTRPLSPAGGVEVLDLDVTADLSEPVKAELGRLFDEHGVVLFRDQKIDKPNVIKITHLFGTPELSPLGQLHDPEFPEVGIFSTHGVRGEVTPDPDEIAGKVDWHTDGAYVTTPNMGGVIYSAEIPPEDGMTGFIDMKRLYDDLSPEMRARVDDLWVILSWAHAQETISRNPTFRRDAKGSDPNRFPPMVGPAARKHPKYGARCLHIPPLWSAGFLGLPPEESQALLKELTAHVRNPKYAYWHSYRPGDVVAWDNWRMLHAASGTKGIYRRTMHRTVIRGGIEMSVPLSEAEKGKRPAELAA